MAEWTVRSPKKTEEEYVKLSISGNVHTAECCSSSHLRTIFASDRMLGEHDSIFTVVVDHLSPSDVDVHGQGSCVVGVAARSVITDSNVSFEHVGIKKSFGLWVYHSSMADLWADGEVCAANVFAGVVAGTQIALSWRASTRLLYFYVGNEQVGNAVAIPTYDDFILAVTLKGHQSCVSLKPEEMTLVVMLSSNEPLDGDDNIRINCSSLAGDILAVVDMKHSDPVSSLARAVATELGLSFGPLSNLRLVVGEQILDLEGSEDVLKVFQQG